MKKLSVMLLALILVLGMVPVAIAEEPVVLTWQTWNPGDDLYTHTIIENFEAAYPNIKIEYTYMPYSDHVADMQIKMNNGEGPDIFCMQTGATYEAFRPYEVDLTPYAEASWGEGWQSKFLDFCMDLLNEDGAYYGMPLGLTYAGFVWADAEMLHELGLEVPTNYNELVEVCQALRDKGEYPLTIGAKDDWINIDTFFNIANDINAEKLYSAIEGETAWTDEDLVKAFQIWQNCFTDGVFQDGCLGVNMYNDTTDIFDYGDAALHLNGSWLSGDYLNQDNLDVNEVFNHEGADHEVFLLDWDNDGDTAGCQASIDVVLCINSNSEHVEEAWTFVNYLLHEGQDYLINERLYYFPSRTDLELNVKGLNEDGTAAVEYMLEQAATNTAGYREMAYADLKLAICEALKALGTGEMTAEQAGAHCEAASQAQAR